MPDPAAPFRVLLCVAAPAEWRAVRLALGVEPGAEPSAWSLAPLAPRIDLLFTGIGKSNAAAALARFIDPARHGVVLNAGVSGALPESGLELGAALAATACAYADEGVESSNGFRTLPELGFPMGPFAGVVAPVDGAVRAWIERETSRAGGLATVSTCSGTEARARAVRARTGAAAEDMESAALAHVCAVVGARFGALRVISNTTGERDAQRWDLPRALANLSAVLGRLLARMPSHL